MCANMLSSGTMPVGTVATVMDIGGGAAAVATLVAPLHVARTVYIAKTMANCYSCFRAVGMAMPLVMLLTFGGVASVHASTMVMPVVMFYIFGNIACERPSTMAMPVVMLSIMAIVTTMALPMIVLFGAVDGLGGTRSVGVPGAVPMATVIFMAVPMAVPVASPAAMRPAAVECLGKLEHGSNGVHPTGVPMAMTIAIIMPVTMPVPMPGPMAVPMAIAVVRILGCFFPPLAQHQGRVNRYDQHSAQICDNGAPQ
mmetsp:Transcript_24399/g.68534  ORF Transcript_24399/g.68534 Transcript_24399/m.68534 type:complete len:255 (-) Transcript_24399:200-964(-)